MDIQNPVSVKINNARIGLHEGKVFAFLLDDGRATTWNFNAVAGGYQIQNADTGNLLALPAGYEANSQVVASSSDPKTPNSIWVVSEIALPRITVQLAGAENMHLGRSYVEDRSMAPKAVVAGDPSRVTGQILIEPAR